VRRKLIGAFILMIFSAVLHNVGFSQHPEGRWIIGIRGGGNLWLNDLNQRKFGFGGEAIVRYGVARYFSLGLIGGYEVLKANQSVPLAGLPYPYLRFESIPGFLVGWFHLRPGGSFSPYVYVGAGAMLFRRKDFQNLLVPDDKFKTAVLIPVGAGFEAYASRSLSFTVDFGYRISDDYSDFFKHRFPDSYPTVKAGIHVYMGTSDADDDDEDRLINGEERTFGTDPELADTDGDGLKDGEEVKRYHINPLKADSDGDELTDGDEVFKYHTDPANPNSDGDGLSDGDELLKYNTNPLKIDTDGDVLTDGDEVLKHTTDPWKADSDGDSLPDWDEVKIYMTDATKSDTDGDGLSDSDEIKTYKTHPAKADTDGGGVSDGDEIARKSSPIDPKDDSVEKGVVLRKGATVILEGINFQSGSVLLTVESETRLEKVFDALTASPELEVEIIGYTDNAGPVEVNQQLSLRRAQAVRTWLIKKGVASRRLTATGKGSRDPVASNDTPEGRAKNRRIEFHVKK